MRVSRNNTTLFILPLLDMVKEVIIDEHFINTFLAKDDSYILIRTNRGDYTLPINPALQKTIQTFTNGHYSRFPNHYKQKILNFWTLSKGSKMHSILYPKQWVLETNRGMSRIGEVWAKPNQNDYYLN